MTFSCCASANLQLESEGETPTFLSEGVRKEEICRLLAELSKSNQPEIWNESSRSFDLKETAC